MRSYYNLILLMIYYKTANHNKIFLLSGFVKAELTA